MSIELRDNTWFAYMRVPADVREKLGRSIFRVSLKTDSKAVAERRAAIHMAEWKALVETARGQMRHNDETYWRGRGGAVRIPRTTRRRGPDYPEYWRGLLRAAKTAEEREQLLEHLSDAVSHVAAINDPGYGTPIQHIPEAVEFFSQAMAVDTASYADEWLAATTTAPKTKDMHRSDLMRFAGAFPTLDEVVRPAVRRWTTKVMNEGGLSPKTVQRVLSALRGYWRYLQSVGVVAEDQEPFTKLDVARQGRREGQRTRRREFDPADVVKLLRGAVAGGDDQLADLIRLGMWSGCRIEELCALKVADVASDRFRVTEAKSGAGVRVVPIHSQVAQTVARLVQESRDGFVLSGLSFNKYGDRSNAIGKRFGRLRTAMGYGPELVFHSIRKCVVTELENAGLPENTVADIVGHEKPRVTYGLYSGGARFDVLKAAIEKLNYPSSG